MSSLVFHLQNIPKPSGAGKTLPVSRDKKKKPRNR